MKSYASIVRLLVVFLLVGALTVSTPGVEKISARADDGGGFQQEVTISAGTNHTCGIQSDGTLICWGLNDEGQASPPEGTFRQVSAGNK